MGMNEGHAVEGVILALCRIILAAHPNYTVEHTHPDLPLTMKTDVLVFVNNLLHTNIMVCHSDNEDYAHRKIKRTRQEYVEALQLREKQFGASTTDNYRVINFVFGMPNGWHDSQIEYMKTYLSPTIYLPELLDKTTYESFMQVVMSEFRKCNKKKNKWPEVIYTEISEGRITLPGQQQLCEILENAIFSADMQNTSTLGADRTIQEDTSREVNLPKPFATRYRQGLSLLNTFSREEIDGIYQLISSGETTVEMMNSLQKKSLIRAIWLGLVHIPPNVSTTLHITPRRRELVSQVDFSEPFDTLALTSIHSILDTLNDYASHNSKPFLGGIQYLSISNYSVVSKCATGLAAALLNYINQPTEKAHKQLLSIFERDELLVPSITNLLPSRMGFRVCRSIFAAFLSVIDGDAKLGGKHGYGFTSSECISAEDVDSGLKLMMRHTEEAINELHLIHDMCAAFERDDCSEIIRWHQREKRPQTFDIQIPGSWLQRFYFVIVSHAAYNPLMSILYTEIVLPRHSDCTIFGFPSKLAESLESLYPASNSPGKYRIIVKEGNNTLHIYEALTITENNLGNKSKELFDRIGSAKTWGRENHVNVIFHGLFDGDFSTRVMEEFTSEGRYDEFISIRDQLAKNKPQNASL